MRYSCLLLRALLLLFLVGIGFNSQAKTESYLSTPTSKHVAPSTNEIVLSERGIAFFIPKGWKPSIGENVILEKDFSKIIIDFETIPHPRHLSLSQEMVTYGLLSRAMAKASNIYLSAQGYFIEREREITIRERTVCLVYFIAPNNHQLATASSHKNRVLGAFISINPNRYLAITGLLETEILEKEFIQFLYSIRFLS